MPLTTKANTLTDKTKNDLSKPSPNRFEREDYSNQSPNVVTAPNTRTLFFGLSPLHWLYLIGLCTATLITWVTSQNITQFKQHGPVAFQDGFPGDLDQWSRRGGWENILFDPDSIKVNRDVDKASYAFRTFALSPSDNRAREKLQVTGKVDTLSKKPASDTSDGGAFMLWLQDDSDKVVKYLNIGKLDGLSDNYELSRIVNLTDNITRFSLVLTNKQTSAEFALVNASVSLLTEQPTFLKIRAVIFLAWTLMLLVALYYLFTHASGSMFALILGVVSLTIVGVLMPETISSGTVKPIYASLQNLTGLTGDRVLEYAYKIGHFVFFFLSTLILLLYRRKLRLPAWEVFFLMIIFAIATEGLQLYLSDRSTRFSDLLIDFSAIIAGAMLATVILALRAVPSNKPEPPAALQ